MSILPNDYTEITHEHSTDYISQVVTEVVIMNDPDYVDQNISQAVIEVVILEVTDIFGPKIQVI